MTENCRGTNPRRVEYSSDIEVASDAGALDLVDHCDLLTWSNG
jgi:hypothetical protein